ncbi:hypothetical protein [Neokomagataea anthophila]|uniref:Uncharacterized protein n=1 Tax=Neokomagataea anthophila TaxID=2826925 RepID=A0ABS5E825_9PROT|nr:hypothetical protein [Neokomagataea anthophila]MBR0560065.1 hypothetical protein [Neokomagataea anthophila]
MREITFTLPEPFPLLNKQQRKHYRTRGRAKVSTSRQIIALLGSERPQEPFQRASVHVVRHSVGSPDLDGLYGGFKDILDCLTTPVQQANGKVKNKHGVGLIVDDNQLSIRLNIEGVRCRRDEQKTVVTITEILDAEVGL